MIARRWDAVVVGGGPAGALLATLLGRQGRAVLLLERGLQPRPKACGEFLGPAGLAVLARAGLAGRVRARGLPVERLALASGQQAIRATLPESGVGIRREVLDELLLAEASATAVVRRGEVVMGLTSAGASMWQLATSHGMVAAPLVVGADGRLSQVRAWSGLGIARERTGRHALVARAVLPGAWRTGEMHIGPLGQIGICPLEQLPGRTLVNLNLLLTAAGADLLRRRAPERLITLALRATESLRGRVHGMACCSAVRAASHLRQRARRVAGVGIALIGDAALSCDPIAGEGMSLALADAESLARHLAAAPDAEALMGYASTHQRSHARHRMELRLLPPLLERPQLFGAVVATAALARAGSGWLARRHDPQPLERTR